MIGKALKYMRINKGLNQTQMAQKLNIGQTTLSGYERGYRNPTFDIIEKISEICGYSICFKNNKSKDEFVISDLKRKDI